MAKGRRVAIPSVGRIYTTDYVSLIKGKRYEVINEDEISFSIKNEMGNSLHCLKAENECAHLECKGSWKLLTERK